VENLVAFSGGNNGATWLRGSGLLLLLLLLGLLPELKREHNYAE